MKKVIKLSVIAVFAIVAYTNVSLIGEELNMGDVNLSSVIQNAHALTEATGPNCKYEKTITEEESYRLVVGNICRIVDSKVDVCSGTGSHCCLGGQIQTTRPCS